MVPLLCPCLSCSLLFRCDVSAQVGGYCPVFGKVCAISSSICPISYPQRNISFPCLTFFLIFCFDLVLGSLRSAEWCLTTSLQSSPVCRSHYPQIYDETQIHPTDIRRTVACGPFRPVSPFHPPSFKLFLSDTLLTFATDFFFNIGRLCCPFFDLFFLLMLTLFSGREWSGVFFLLCVYQWSSKSTGTLRKLRTSSPLSLPTPNP